MAAVWFCTVGAAWAADYYVSTTGNDSASGTILSPWRTIQKGASSVGPGDTVHIRGGVYVERISLSGRAGTSAQPIVIRSYSGETAILDQTGVTPPNGSSAIIRLNNCSHITLKGLELCNYKTASSNKVPIGIHVSGGGAGVKLLQNRIHGIWQSYDVPRSFAGNAHGILVAGNSSTAISGLLIEGNEVYDLRLGASEAVVLNGNVTGFTVRGNIVRDCNNIGIDFIGYEGTNNNPSLDVARNGLCVGNTVYNIDSQFNPAYGGDFISGGGDSTRAAAGIYVDGGANIVIERNHVYHCNFGIEVGCENASRAATGIVVRNNLVRRNHVGGIFVGGYDDSVGGTTSSSITHNTLYQNDTSGYGGGQIALQHNISTTRIRHNILVCNSSTRQFILSTSTTSSFATGDVDWNLYTGSSSTSAEFIWWDQSRTGFAAWRSASAQDAHSIFSTAAGFMNAAGGDFALTAGSPAVDAGDPAFLPVVGEVDYDGRARVFGSRVDMGMSEQGSPLTGAPDVETLTASGLTYFGATLQGNVNPGGIAADVWFEYGTTLALGRRTSVQSLAAGTLDQPVSAVLDGLMHKKKYFFRIAASNQLGVNVGVTRSFTTPAMPPPVVLSQPLPALVHVGEPVTFSASASGGQPMTWKWRRNGIALSGPESASDRYQLVAAGTGHAGSYAVRVSNASDDVVSQAAALVVVSPDNEERSVNEGTILSLQASYSGPDADLEFEWLKDGIPMTDDERISGAASGRLVIKHAGAEDQAAYQCRIRLGVIERLTGVTQIEVRLLPVMHSFSPRAPWVVSGAVDDLVTASHGSDRFAIRGLPMGVTLDPRSGRLSGKPSQAGIHTLFITASNEVGTSALVSAIIDVQALPGASVGSFQGIVERNAAASQDNLGGGLRFTVAASGALSGSLSQGGRTHRFVGRVDAGALPGPTASVFIPRGRAASPLQLSIAMDGSQGTALGSVSEPIDGSVVISELQAVRNDWHQIRNPAALQAGRYTALILPPEELGADPTVPHGSGYATVRVGKDGRVQATGFLADGTAWSHATILDRSGRMPVFDVVADGTASLLGWLGILLDEPTAYAGNTIQGLVSWYRISAPPGTRRVYANGIPEHELNVEGSRWLAPTQQQRLLNLTAPEDTMRLELTRGSVEPSPPAVLPVRVKNDYRTIVQLEGSNPVDVSLTLSPATGMFSGRFTLLDPDPVGGAGLLARRIVFRGIILSRQAQAGGFFLLPGLPSPASLPPVTLQNSPITSGRVSLEPMRR